MRHPGRWVAVAISLVLVAMLVHWLVFEPGFQWGTAFTSMFASPVLRGLLIGTLFVTVLAMTLAIVLGTILAIMRMSENPVLRTVSFAFVWFFRAIPRIVLLTFLGAAGTVFPDGIAIGIPFDQQIMGLLGMDGDWRFLELNANQVFNGLLGATLGLGLSEAAYMAEITRAGILSVDHGQVEAASALGMDRRTTMRRIQLPQAMRVIVPPTGNELISMVKDTSLLSALPFTAEMFFQLQAIGTRTFTPIPNFLAAMLWYLVIGTVLMIGQYFLEKRFGRGFGATSAARRTVPMAPSAAAPDDDAGAERTGGTGAAGPTGPEEEPR